ncbi:MAG: DUF4388 domain-containing protein, partial [Desulfobulbaceae bacterium]|nr:DUF4388 domain-containing protein [Desulfobulbaceae bacterium]
QTQTGITKSKFNCGGCSSGIICFEYKKAKAFTTMQMKLLAAADRREKIKGVSQFAGLLRTIETFSALSDNDLLDLATLLELSEYPWQFPIIQKGDPGNRFFIIISGTAEVIDEYGTTLATMQKGDVFGEMSLLTGERVSITIMASSPCQVAVMTQKNFKHILSRFPALQIFFYKLLVSRVIKMNLQRTEELASGMVGQLSDIAPVELCQMINTNQKTGKLHVEYERDHGLIVFNEGEVIDAQFKEKTGNEAFYEILSLEDGRFKFIQGLNTGEKELPVLGSFMALLMEGLKRFDDNT